MWISIIPLLVSLLSIGVMVVSAAEYPAIYVDPPSIMDLTLTPGENFTISIKTDCTGDAIHSYQFTLFYNPQVLNGVAVTNGDLITTDKDPTATFLPGTFNNTEGKLSMSTALFFFSEEPAPVTYGPGTLANVTFTVVGYGGSDITLGNETKLKGYTEGINPDTGETEPGYGDPYNIIDAETMPDHIQHGYFSNVMPGDIDGGGDVDPGDFSIFAGAYGTSMGQLDYNPNCNLDGDGEVDPADLFDLSKNYGKTT